MSFAQPRQQQVLSPVFPSLRPPARVVLLLLALVGRTLSVHVGNICSVLQCHFLVRNSQLSLQPEITISLHLKVGRSERNGLSGVFVFKRRNPRDRVGTT